MLLLLEEVAPPAPPLEDDPPAPPLEDDAPVLEPLPLLALLALLLPLLEEDASVLLDIAFPEHPDATAVMVARRRVSKE